MDTINEEEYVDYTSTAEEHELPPTDPRQINVIDRIKYIQGWKQPDLKDDDIQEDELEVKLNQFKQGLSKDFLKADTVGQPGGITPLNGQMQIDECYLPVTTTGISAVSLDGTMAEITAEHVAVIPTTTGTCAGLFSCENKAKLDSIDPTELATKDEVSNKQDKISDLKSIRSGAALGATAIQSHQDISGKQDKLTAGTNITITDNVISASGTSYTAGNGIDINDNTISTKLGNGLKYTDDGKITLRAADKSISAGEFGVHVPVITTSLDVTDNGLAVKFADNTIEAYNSGTGTKGIRVNQNVIQPKLSAGDNVSISNNVISSIDTKLATQITLGKAITAQAAIGGISAGKVYAATDTLATLLEDLLGSSSPTPPVGTKYLYTGIVNSIPDSVTGLTSVEANKDTLLASGYTYKNITTNGQYAVLAIDESLGLSCYSIKVNGFDMGFLTKDLGDQILYYFEEPTYETSARYVYSFEEV